MWAFVADEDEPPELTDFGYHNDENYLWETATMFVNSDYKVMPQAGGWDDQFADWRDDITTWSALYRRIRWEKRQQDSTDTGQKRQPQYRDALPFEDEMGGGQNWQSLIGE